MGALRALPDPHETCDVAVVRLSVTAGSLGEADELPNVTEINRKWHRQVTKPIVSKNKAASSKTAVGARLLLQALPDFPFEISLPPIPSPYSTFLSDLAVTSTYGVSHHQVISSGRRGLRGSCPPLDP